MASGSAPYFFMSYSREDVALQWMEQILAGLQRMITVITTQMGTLNIRGTIRPGSNYTSANSRATVD